VSQDLSYLAKVKEKGQLSISEKTSKNQSITSFEIAINSKKS